MANNNTENESKVVMVRVPQNLKEEATMKFSDIWDLIVRLKWWILGSMAVALIAAFSI